jgi:hypothetical protein
VNNFSYEAEVLEFGEPDEEIKEADVHGKRIEAFV